MAKKKNTAVEKVEKESKISVNSLDKIMESVSANEETVEWNGLEVKIKKSLSLKEMMAFVRDVSNSCFANDTGEYLPEIREFAIRANIMEVYANFALPANLGKRYEVVMHSGAVEMIKEHIDMIQHCDIVAAIDEKVANMAAANVEMVHIKLDKLVESFNGLYEKLTEMYDGITTEDMQNLISALRDHKFSAADIVGAFLNQKKEDA